MRTKNSSSTPAAKSHWLIRLVLWSWQGCFDLPGYGPHPGNGYMIMLIAFGAIAGVNGGWETSIFGAVISVLIFGPFYIGGAYGRAKDFHSQNGEARHPA